MAIWLGIRTLLTLPGAPELLVNAVATVSGLLGAEGILLLLVGKGGLQDGKHFGMQMGILSCLAIGSGIGLLLRKRWARPLSIAISMLYMPVMMFLNFLVFGLIVGVKTWPRPEDVLAIVILICAGIPIAGIEILRHRTVKSLFH